MKGIVMKCNEVREIMPDLAAGLAETTLEMNEHLRGCAECSGKLQAFRQTMSLLDQWQVPDPSPYFDTRVRARVREERAARPAGWFEWLRKPALAVSLALLMVMGVTLMQKGGVSPQEANTAQIEPGSAVGDLQALDKNHELYSEFDVLDDLQVQDDVNANP
jgi:predicted anti-sigma-YlaC factor YlaD